MQFLSQTLVEMTPVREDGLPVVEKAVCPFCGEDNVAPYGSDGRPQTVLSESCRHGLYASAAGGRTAAVVFDATRQEREHAHNQ